MPSQRFAVVLACFLVSQGAVAQIRREGPPPKPYSGFEMSSPVIEVPMLAGDEVLLEVRVDGKGPYSFALDTGAARGGRIDAKLAKTLGLPVVGRALTGDPTGKNRQDAEIVQAHTLTLGGASFKDVELIARDFQSGPGTTLDGSYIGKVPLEKDPEVVGHGRTSFNEFEIKQAPLKGGLHIAGQTVEHIRVDFVEIFPQGNLGAAFLRRFVVTIDGKNHRLRLRGAGPAKITRRSLTTGDTVAP